MDATRKAIVILGGGEQQIPAIESAHKLGYDVVCPDIDAMAQGLKLVKYPLPEVSTHDPQQLIDEIKCLNQRRINVSGIVAIGVEASNSVAVVSDYFGFNAVSIDAAQRSSNKIARLKCFKEYGIPCPDFGVAHNIQEAKSICDNLGYPVVFKPVALAGAKGVVIINNAEQVDRWFDFTYQQSGTEILIESYLEGTEHSSESIVHDRIIDTTGFSDRNYNTKFLYPPHLLENGDTCPTILDETIRKEIFAIVEAAIHALGITAGPAKGDIIVTSDGKPRLLEMAARASGDYFASVTAPCNNGTDIISAIIQQAVGDDINPDFLTWKYNKGVALRYVWPKPGRIIDIQGLDEVKTMLGVKFFNWEPYWKTQNIGVGTVITPPTSHRERVASVLAVGDSRSQAIKIAEEAVDRVRVITRK